MTTTETDITNALITATYAALAPLGFTDTPPLISFPGVPFTVPDAQTRYIEVLHFRNPPDDPNWTDGKYFTGIWQISLIDFTQLGEVPAMVTCSQIADAFAKDTDLWNGATRVKITATPAILSVIEEGHKRTYPVSIRYRCGT